MLLAIPQSIRHHALTYLRAPASSRGRLACVAFAAMALAAVLPPPIALPRIAQAGSSMFRAWPYFCSMVLGAAPFLVGGAFVAAVASRVPRSWSGIALPVFAVFFPGCDCSMNAYAATLARARAWLAAFAIVWGSCCNPLALFSTAVVLGPRMLAYRVAAGFVAASLTALAWSRHAHVEQNEAVECIRPNVARVFSRHHTHVADFWDDFVRSAGSGLASFSIAASVGAASLVVFSHGAPCSGRTCSAGSAGLAAALLGAILSPCSSADSLLARVLFAQPANQITFIVASQCLDVRQFIMLRRAFGLRRTWHAFGASALACCVGYLLARV